MITLNTPLTFILQPEVKIELTNIEIQRIIDNPNEKFVRAFINGISDIILWEGNEYDAIGNWTQEQAEARIIELLTK